MEHGQPLDAATEAAIDQLRVYYVCPGPAGGNALHATAQARGSDGLGDPALLAGATVEKSRNADGIEVEWETSDSPRLIALQAQFDSGTLSEETRLALLALDGGFTTVRPWPPIHPMTPGTFRTCMQFDLSERAVELLAAAGARELLGM